MKLITSKECKAKFGACLRLIHSGPILISKSGRPAAVLMTVKAYEQLQFQGNLKRVTLGTGNITSSGLSQLSPDVQGDDALLRRLAIVAARTARTVGELINAAIEEKVADWEERANIETVLRGGGKRWTLSDLSAGKDLWPS